MALILKWHMFAGGTGAAPGKHGYSAATTVGKYDISPISNQWGRHMGYRLYFINDKGKLRGGLWQQIGGLYRSPNDAKGAAMRHMESHFRQYNPREVRTMGKLAIKSTHYQQLKKRYSVFWIRTRK